MKRSLEEHAARFDARAADYDGSKTGGYCACASLVIEHASPGPDEVVLDVGTGTGAITPGLAGRAGRVLGRDTSEGACSNVPAGTTGRAEAGDRR